MPRPLFNYSQEIMMQFHRSTVLKHGLATVSLLIAMLLARTSAASTPTEAFDAQKDKLFVIELADRTSNNKNSVGSGFAVQSGAYLASNYHVVAEAALKPEDYKLRAVPVDGDPLSLRIVAADPVNDLAILEVVPEEGDAGTLGLGGIELAEQAPEIGEEIFALGNPLDVGLSVVPGVYNGEPKKHFRKRIHFTGALNPGMSGGPAVNSEGEVVGINVAGAGNSVGFLVPVSELRALLDRLPEASTLSRAEFAGAIRQHHAALIDDLIEGDWSLESFGPLRIPKAVRDYVNCRGGSISDEDEPYWSKSMSDCRVGDRLFLNRGVNAGRVEMQFLLVESDALSPMQFARLLGTESFRPLNRGNREHYTKHECIDRWTTLPYLENVPFKASYCVRAYLDFPEIYDVLYVARATPERNQGVFVHYTLAGVGREAADRFHRHFMGVPRWN